MIKKMVKDLKFMGFHQNDDGCTTRNGAGDGFIFLGYLRRRRRRRRRRWRRRRTLRMVFPNGSFELNKEIQLFLQWFSSFKKLFLFSSVKLVYFVELKIKTREELECSISVIRKMLEQFCLVQVSSFASWGSKSLMNLHRKKIILCHIIRMDESKKVSKSAAFSSEEERQRWKMWKKRTIYLNGLVLSLLSSSM